MYSPSMMRPSALTGWGAELRPGAGSCARFDSGSFLVAKALENLEHLAPGGEHPSASLLVGLHRLHEFQLCGRVVALASRGIDQPPPITSGAGAGSMGRPPAGLSRVLEFGREPIDGGRA